MKVVKDAGGNVVAFGPNDDNYDPMPPAGGSVVIDDTFVPPPAQDQAFAAQAAKNAADAQAAKVDAKLVALAAMTPAQVRAWAAANINTLADAKDALATLAVCVAILARKL